jgi:hypothetical protein
MKALSPAQVESRKEQSKIRMIYKKIHSVKRTRFSAPEKEPLMLPEDFTGRDLKRLQKLIKGRKKK